METKEVKVYGKAYTIKKLTFGDMGHIQGQGTKITMVGRNPQPTVDLFKLQLATLIRGTTKLPNGGTIGPTYFTELSPHVAEKLYTEIDDFNLPPSTDDEESKKSSEEQGGDNESVSDSNPKGNNSNEGPSSKQSGNN